MPRKNISQNENYSEEENENQNENNQPQKTKSNFPIIIFIIFVICGAVYFDISAPGDFTYGGIVTISPGESLKEFSSTLASSGYIRSQFLFTNLVIFFGGDKHLSQGDYYFEKPVNVIDLARQIAKGQHNLDPVKITIPEGRNISEISEIFKNKLSEFDEKVFKEKAKEYEGYLFPETYFIYPKTDTITVLNEMRDMFNKEAKPLIKKENILNKSEGDIVIMASLIEREARGDDDRAIISGILWNRLDKQIPLQVDATVAYAKNIPEGSLQKSDMGFDSPYNTYIYRGFPPGPISNPGTLALEAAMHPAVVPYLYYLHDKHGNIHYAKTYVEHQENINNYLR